MLAALVIVFKNIKLLKEYMRDEIIYDLRSLIK
jgi:hypothetical protein